MYQEKNQDEKNVINGKERDIMGDDELLYPEAIKKLYDKYGSSTSYSTKKCNSILQSEKL